MGEFLESKGDVWQIFDDLTLLTGKQFKDSKILGTQQPTLEDCLRRVLRPHDEAGFEDPADKWMVELRGDVDEALGALTFREIRRELLLPNEALSPDLVRKLCDLFRSEAFLRYVNAYLYFGVRFLPFDSEFIAVSDCGDPEPCADSNVLSFPLKAPPPLQDIPHAQEYFDKFRLLLQDDRQDPVLSALQFLDDFHQPQLEPVLYELQEPTAYELWLRGLRPEAGDAQKERFKGISEGLAKWAKSRSDFYLSLAPLMTASIQSGEDVIEKRQGERPPQGWLVTNPIAARLALADIYWIARLLRADVSANAWVRYQKYNWLHLLRFHSILNGDLQGSRELNKAEEALRSVFDSVCDVIQNSIEATRASKDIELPSTTWRWRAVFDEELKEIANQRRIRHFRDPSLPPEGSAVQQPEPATSTSPSRTEEHIWGKKVLGYEVPHNRIGIAFSGGGIRSATLNLGVLQGLQELDLLRHIDYLSTVSGGGFIGSWLAANVRRSAHWLGRMTDWSDSITHLRNYSNYLAPRTGILSADTWNLATSWLRNAFLIQLTSVAWLFFLLLITIVSLRIFLFVGALPWLAPVLAVVATVLVVAAVSKYLTGILSNAAGKICPALRIDGPADEVGSTSAFAQKLHKFRRTIWIMLFAVTPAWVGAFMLASYLWANAPLNEQKWRSLKGVCSFSELLEVAWRPWLGIVIIAVVSFAILACATLRWRRLHAAWISPLCTGIFYLELAGIFYFFRDWSMFGDVADGAAFVFGPALVLLAFAVCILLLIGFTGRNTNEAQREWWTRFGTWLAIFSGISIFVCGAAVFGPWLIWRFFVTTSGPLIKTIRWTTVLSWIGTVIGGLFAGKSSKTTGQADDTNAPILEVLAKVGSLLFIIGCFLFGSTLLYDLLFGISSLDSALTGANPLHIFCILNIGYLLIALLVVLLIGGLFSRYFEINIFGLSEFYRNRLVRCYLGATRWTRGMRNPNPFTKFDFQDDLKLSRFRTDSPAEDVSGGKECGPYRGPFPILNCSLNLAGSADLALNTRHSASFILTPLRCGSDRPRVGYAPIWIKGWYRFAHGVPLGQAVAASGAAVSSNMGYNTSPLVAFLLTMFNVRLGWWFPNPGQDQWQERGLNFSLRYLLEELFGVASDKSKFVNVTDGGHFENLGIYELIRRRCRLIIASDAECDEDLEFGGLGKMIRICETDFGAIIDLDVKSIRPQANGLSLAHCAVGTIKYCTGEIGRLIYLKASMTGDEDVSITQYRSSHPSFPHESTANQFYSEDQFESYRKLGLHIVRSSFQGNLPGDDPLLIAERMFDVLIPAGPPSEKFLKHSTALTGLWEKFRATPTLLPFMNELITVGPAGPLAVMVSNEELCIGLELIQLMEEVFLDLKLDDFWEHPDNRGWAILFMRWARSPKLRAIWERARRTFGIRFEYFCSARLGLTTDQPIARV